MSATHMQTPFGPMPISEHLRRRFDAMTDREVADDCFKSQPGFIRPEAFAELVHRRLCFRGDFERDVYARVDRRETTEDKS